MVMLMLISFMMAKTPAAPAAGSVDAGSIQLIEETIRLWKRALVRRLVAYHDRHDTTVKRLVVLAWIGAIGLPMYYLVWQYWFPQPYENFTLRLIGVVICVPGLFAQRYATRRWLKTYLFLALSYVLPFFFTFMYLMNHASSVWSQSLLIALVVLFHFDTRMAFAAYVAGTATAYWSFMLLTDGAFLASTQALQQWPIQLFAILLVSVAKIGRAVLAQEKLAGMAQALATVSHELRTPLKSIDANVRGALRLAPAATLEQALERIRFEVRHMNHVIDLFLFSTAAVKRNMRPTERLSMGETVRAMQQRYPYASEQQRAALHVEVRRDFLFAGQRELAAVLLLNLLRNALKALHRAGKGRVRVIVDGGRARPRLLFIDTGCGIDAHNLRFIFQRFYSYPPNAGTGIGLALCKEILEAWGATIRCTSRAGAYAIFVMEFPASAEEALVDDNAISLKNCSTTFDAAQTTAE
jgi:two-component system CAI-1 autoinducer sensor kinase/phosphatase CqsS